MSLGQRFLAEFDHEAISTRKALERLPDGHFDFKPHERSASLAELAAHIANIGNWGASTCTKSEIDLAASGISVRPVPPTSAAEAVAAWDKNAEAFRAALAQVTDVQMAELWTLRMGDQVIFSQPRAGVLRGFVMSHMIHHRGQLSVYLRLLNVPVPSMYGPSADETNF
jgi:uncharacterized damage-inducible protein DinB